MVLVVVLSAMTATTGSVAAGASIGSQRAAERLAAFYRAPLPSTPEPAGSIVRMQAIPSDGQLTFGATAYRVLYHSQTISGSDVVVSGMVIVPGGNPPKGGFPIVSWAHATTGVASECSPSVAGFSSIPSLNWMIDHRMVVAATDYQGLGGPATHPYLVGTSEAQNVLDAARAARNVVGTAASNKVVVVGFSQGGQAALFAAQIAQSYAPELYVTGAVAAAPVTSLNEFVDAEHRAEAVAGGGHDQDAVFTVMALDTWAATYGNLPLDSVLTAAARQKATALATECSGPLGAVFARTAVDKLFPKGWSQVSGLRADELANDPGQAPSFSPLLVVEGTDDTITPYKTVRGFVAGALCRSEHDTVDFDRVPAAGHGNVMEADMAGIHRWILQRVAGAAPADTCSS